MTDFGLHETNSGRLYFKTNTDRSHLLIELNENELAELRECVKRAPTPMVEMGPTETKTEGDDDE